MASRGLGLLSRKDAGVHLVDHLRALTEAVEFARVGGLPASAQEEEAALPPGERRLAIDPPTVTQIPSVEAADDSDIVDAELVDQPREERR